MLLTFTLTCPEFPSTMYGMAADPVLAARIRDARQRLNMSQQELAARVHRSVKTVNSWENARTSPKNALGALKAVLGSLDGEPPPFVPADDDEARIWAMNEPEEWRRKIITWKRQGQARAAS